MSVTARIIYPKSAILKQYIKYFLFIESSDENYYQKHTSFPNTNVCLGLFKNNKLNKLSKNVYSVSKNKSTSSYLTGLYTKPCVFSYQGSFKEVCIDFEPLGLDAISGVKLSHYSFFNNIIEEKLSKNWQGLYKVALSSKTAEERADEMEDFFISVYRNNLVDFYPFNSLLTNQVQDLTTLFNKSYRTIHRLYQKKLGISPKEFLMMKRFRFCIDANLDSATHNLSYEFADQSHFIKTFKKYADLTPKAFFKQSEYIDNEVWIKIG